MGHGNYQQQPPPQQYQQPPPQYQQPPNYSNPEADSIISMVNIASIFGIIIAIVAVLGGIYFIWAYSTYEAVTSIYGDYGITNLEDSAVRTGFMIYAVVLFLIFLFGVLFFVSCRKIAELVRQGRYQEGKSKALVWTIIGIIFAGLIPGILLLIAYLKFDPLIRNTQPNYMPPPQPQYQQPPPQQQYQQQPPPQQYQQPPPPQQQPPQQGQQQPPQY